MDSWYWLPNRDTIQIPENRRLDVPSGPLGRFGVVALRLGFYYSCIAEFYGGPRALVLRASTCCAGLDRRMLLVAQASFPEEASTQGFRSSPACKASGLSLYRSLRRPFSFPSEERVGSTPLPVPTRILTFG